MEDQLAVAIRSRPNARTCAFRALHNLVRDGLVARRVEPTVPPRVHYRLTEPGLSLEVPLAALRTWAVDHMAEIDRAGTVYDAQAGSTASE
ncbi:helix-turn-helix transcriptional regulator [Nocardia sp. NBC_01503]|uniref:winged helix-turn-helix transcriptional regulator n=1 Tax=Nocardia sp. NBC_01503 TaxID=2975997 RepID=UPI002E7BE37F|nr:helix-turn-helix domain-containing protein [Nocardia sp. NBC_01503]WTL32572.1 helix-turn-helix transcriptional regulator [Nocardia sp. NBC_01503]